MKNKYYTPEIEEFHVGFEYEFRTTVNWESKIFSENDFGSYFNPDGIEGKLKESRLRVKYLDKADIESLGFQFEIADNQADLYFLYGDFKTPDGQYPVTKYALTHHPETNHLIISAYNELLYEGTLFEGICKNKSKLISLLKDIGKS